MLARIVFNLPMPILQAWRWVGLPMPHKELNGTYRLLWVGRYTSRQHSALYCWLMNLIDFRYWRCECHYRSPYGLSIMGGCEWHD